MLLYGSAKRDEHEPPTPMIRRIDKMLTSAWPTTARRVAACLQACRRGVAARCPDFAADGDAGRRLRLTVRRFAALPFHASA
jgi:hypothetical protein